MEEIYLDNAATTRVYEEVAKEVYNQNLNDYGNPSSLHELGEKAQKEMNEAREKIARSINAKPQEIVFTSGGTESNNFAILGLIRSSPNRKTIIISGVEHTSINEICNTLQSEGGGYKIIKIPVDKQGIIKINDLEKEIEKNSEDLLLVSVINVNNVIGSVQPIAEIGTMCKKRRVIFHTDAVQSFGKLDLDVKKMNIDLLSASAHKIGGPKGVGFLFVKEGVNISPLIIGGGQERGLRSGTENVPGIVGFAKALEMQKKIDKGRINDVRDKFFTELERIGGKINGSKNNRIYNNVHVSFPGIEANTLIAFLSKKGIYVSSGSACESKKKKEDETLKAIGLTKQEQEGSIRITINEEITEKDVYLVVGGIKKALETVRF